MADWALTAIIDVAILIVAGVFAALFKLPEKWLGHAFEAKLEAEKSRLNGEIEQLKARLSHLSDRGKRANELEYDAIIKAWEQFVDAYIATLNIFNTFNPNPGIDQATDEEIKDFLTSTEFSGGQQKHILAAKDRTAAYFKVIQHRAVNRAHDAVYDAHSVLRKQGIFIPKDVEEAILRGLEMVGKALGEQRMRVLHDVPGGLDGTMLMSSQEGKRQFDTLKDLVRDRLLIAAAPK